MPWCDPCVRFYNPNSVNPDGSCPTCGHAIDAPVEVIQRNTVPWHFWLLLAAAVVYLGWRLIQGILLLPVLF